MVDTTTMAKIQSKFETRRGQLVVEVLITLGIFALVIAAIIALSFGNQSLSVDSQNSNEAIYIAEDAVESAKASAKANFSGLSSSSGTSGIFTRTTTVTSISSYEKRVDVSVVWQTDPLRVQRVELSTLVTDPLSILNTGDPGCGGIVGDWTNPQSMGSVDLTSGNKGTDLDVIDKMVYMTGKASSLLKKDFFVIDANNPASPTIVGTLHTGPGLNAVDAAGDYAYVANSDTNGELQIISVAAPTAPALVGTYNILGTAEATTVHYLDDKVYLGTKKNALGGEFHVFDVSVPAVPVPLGSFEIDDNVNKIYVGAGNKAYLATDLNNAGLMVLNVADPLNIALLGQAVSTDTLSVYASNAGAVLIGPAQDLKIMNASNPASITELGSINVGDDTRDIVSGDYLAFIASKNSNRELQIINITNPASPTLHSHLNFPNNGTGIDCEDNYVYMSAESNDALRIITSAP